MGLTARAVTLVVDTPTNLKLAGEESISIHNPDQLYICNEGDTDNSEGYPVSAGKGISFSGLGSDDSVFVISATAQELRVLGAS